MERDDQIFFLEGLRRVLDADRPAWRKRALAAAASAIDAIDNADTPRDFGLFACSEMGGDRAEARDPAALSRRLADRLRALRPARPSLRRRKARRLARVFAPEAEAPLRGCIAGMIHLLALYRDFEIAIDALCLAPQPRFTDIGMWSVFFGAPASTLRAALHRDGPMRGLVQTDEEGDVRLPAMLRTYLADAAQPALKGKALLAHLLGDPATPELGLDAFAHLGTDPDDLRALIAGALSTGATGVFAALIGSPGTGKTTLAHAAGAAAGAAIFPVMGDTGPDRVAHLRLLLRLLRGRRDAVICFDEADDSLAGGERLGAMLRMLSRHTPPGKAEEHALFETAPVPVILTSNGGLDDALLRRAAFVATIPRPSASRRAAILDRIATGRVALTADAAARIADTYVAAPAIYARAVEAAALSGAPDAEASLARSLDRLATTCPDLVELGAPRADGLELDLIEADQPLAPILEAIRAEPGFKLLLTGAPGTGKTQLGRLLARAVDADLDEASPGTILGPFFGQSEQAVRSFLRSAGGAAARQINDAEFVLAPREAARHRHDTRLTVEFLDGVDAFRGRFLALNTNLPVEALDAAVTSRMDAVVTLRPLGPDRFAVAFARLLGAEAPAGAWREGIVLRDLDVVRRRARREKLRDPQALRALLDATLAAKGRETRPPIGFAAAAPNRARPH